jgi:peptidoglycan-associated lipoprotein
MNKVNFSKLLLLALALSVSVTACKKGSRSPTPIFEKGTVSAPSNNNPSGPMEPGSGTLPKTNEPESKPASGPSGFEMTNPGDLSNYDQDREALKADTVYFDFDRYNIKPSEVSKVRAVVDYLKGQSSVSVLIEGHCDERGTPEYNRALGERRADSIRESLINQGVSASRVHTISYGEDKPVDPGHNEAAWGKNRRGEFVVLHPKQMSTGTAEPPH